MMPAPYSLAGRTAIVTGGGSGLGYGIARCLIASGAKVIITGRRREVLENAAKELGAVAMPLDVTEFAALPGFIEEVATQHGTPFILVNNAGIHVKKPALEMSEEEFDSVLRTHLTAAFSLSKAAARSMIANGGGSIVCIASMTSYMGMPLVAGYSAAKSGVMGLVRTLSAEWAAQGVRVNAVAPGWIDTPMLHRALAADAERERKIRGRIQTGGQFGAPEDIGWAVSFLCSDAARYITGTILPVDGGGHASF